MVTTGIKNLKNRLSEYVRLAASGETVLVTEHDRVVAELTAPQPGRAATLPDALLAEAVRNGHVVPALTAPGPLPPRRPIGKLSSVLSDLDRDRSDR